MNSFLIVGLWDSPQEIGFILLVVLILFGSKKLPEMARNLGRTVEEFKRAASNVRSEVMNADLDQPSKPALPAPETQSQQAHEYEAEIAAQKTGSTPPVESKTEVTLNVSPSPPAGTVSQDSVATPSTPETDHVIAVPGTTPADTVSQNETHAEKTA